MGGLAIAIVTYWRSYTGIWINKEKFISKWQGICIVVGLLLLNNPDIELISGAGALLMCAGYIPWGLKILQNKTD